MVINSECEQAFVFAWLGGVYMHVCQWCVHNIMYDLAVV